MNMHLERVPYNLIKNGIKTVEYRLNDPKRQQLKVNDIITFTNKETKEELKVKITFLKKYPNIESMFLDTWDLYLKDYYNNLEEALQANNYYSKNDITKYGCLAIFIQLI